MLVGDIIKTLKLQPHPEGGYYRETYRSEESIAENHLPERFTGDRNFSTCIYYLLCGDDFSAFHRIHSDETWHYYSGMPLHIYIIDNEGTLNKKVLGTALSSGAEPQLTIKAGCWFAAQVANRSGYSLVGCTVSPGFDFRDFEMATQADLAQKYPEHKEIVGALTRQ